MKAHTRRLTVFAVLSSIPAIVFLAVLYQRRFFFRDATQKLRDAATPAATKQHLMKEIWVLGDKNQIWYYQVPRYFFVAILVLALVALALFIIRSARGKTLDFPSELLGIVCGFAISFLLSALMTQIGLWVHLAVPSNSWNLIIYQNRLLVGCTIALTGLLIIGHYIQRRLASKAELAH